MNHISYSRMALSPALVWPAIERRRLSRSRILLLVLPFALLPPVMVFYAGTHYGDNFVQGWSTKSWSLIAPLLFALETVTFAAMVALIQSIANTYQTRIDADDALLLTAVGVIPVSLASLALAVPSLGFNAAALFVALCYGCALFYHGVYTLSDTQEKLFAAHFSHIAVSIGVIWISLMLLPLI